MDEGIMDLEAIDILAWYRILQFLDCKSFKRCRLVSRTIKSYADYMGLSLRITSQEPFESREDSWKAFLNNPDIFFTKVLLALNGGQISSTELGLTTRHQVEYLEVSSRIDLNWLLNVDWTQKIKKLFLRGLDITYSEITNERVISLPCLQKLYLTDTPNGIEVYGVALSFQRSASSTNALLRKIRSARMEVLYVNLQLVGNTDFLIDASASELDNALAQCIQAHSQTLQTVIFMNPETGFNWPLATKEFTSIPYGLKHFNIDFFSNASSDSPWMKMVSQLSRLEGITSYGKVPRKPPAMFPSFIRNLCQKNFSTLNFVHLFVGKNQPALDLGVFGCCFNLEFLHLDIHDPATPVYLTNLAMLPTSLKSLKVRATFGGRQNLITGVPRIMMHPEEIAGLKKLKHLVELVLRVHVSFQNSGLLLRFSRMIIRLPKLSVFFMMSISLDQMDPGIFKAHQAFYERLCELRWPTTWSEYSHFQLGLTFKPDPKTGSEDNFPFICYDQVYGCKSQMGKITEELCLFPFSSRFRTSWPPINRASFRIGRLFRI